MLWVLFAKVWWKFNYNLLINLQWNIYLRKICAVTCDWKFSENPNQIKHFAFENNASINFIMNPSNQIKSSAQQTNATLKDWNCTNNHWGRTRDRYPQIVYLIFNSVIVFGLQQLQTRIIYTHKTSGGEYSGTVNRFLVLLCEAVIKILSKTYTLE